MSWIWIAGGILAGLYFVAKKNNHSRKTAEEIQNEGDPEQAVHDTGRYYRNREIKEAVKAGEYALDSLRAAMERLDDARAWGVCDLLGAGLISSKYKHDKIDDANEWMRLANNDLRMFVKKVEEVTGVSQYLLTGDLVSGMDLFFDQPASDTTVQKRLCSAMARIDSLIVQVEQTVEKLKKEFR